MNLDPLTTEGVNPDGSRTMTFPLGASILWITAEGKLHTSTPAFVLEPGTEEDFVPLQIVDLYACALMLTAPSLHELREDLRDAAKRLYHLKHPPEGPMQ